jgi:methionine-S-sulfoxide reductase
MNFTLLFLLFFNLGQIMDREELAEATFAGGCFWCMEGPFDALPGVKDTIVGYTGGTVDNPSYEQVTSGDTGHTEAVLVVYNPKEVGYEKLLETFWKNIDPTQADGQFADRGSQYRTAIFFHNDEQRKLAEESKAKLLSSEKFKEPIATTIEPSSTFYRAEEYHQDYYKKNSIRYKLYRVGSGRADYLKRTWGEE